MIPNGTKVVWQGYPGTVVGKLDGDYVIAMTGEGGTTTPGEQFQAPPWQVFKADDPRIGIALEHFQFTTAYAARYAMGNGVARETLAATLRDLANAVSNPGDVAENMSPILHDEA